MMRGILWFGIGAAVLGATRFCRTAIAEERKRREGQHHHHDTLRWEAEGGTPMLPARAVAADSAG